MGTQTQSFIYWISRKIRIHIKLNSTKSPRIEFQCRRETLSCPHKSTENRFPVPKCVCCGCKESRQLWSRGREAGLSPWRIRVAHLPLHPPPWGRLPPRSFCLEHKLCQYGWKPSANMFQESQTALGDQWHQVFRVMLMIKGWNLLLLPHTSFFLLFEQNKIAGDLVCLTLCHLKMSWEVNKAGQKQRSMRILSSSSRAVVPKRISLKCDVCSRSDFAVWGCPDLKWTTINHIQYYWWRRCWTQAQTVICSCWPSRRQADWSWERNRGKTWWNSQRCVYSKVVFDLMRESRLSGCCWTEPWVHCVLR